MKMTSNCFNSHEKVDLRFKLFKLVTYEIALFWHIIAQLKWELITCLKLYFEN